MSEAQNKSGTAVDTPEADRFGIAYIAAHGVVRAGEEIDRLRAALTAAEKRQQWQPIETAPKDKQEGILGYVVGVGARVIWWDAIDRHWRTSLCEQRPTHWMPLPEAP